MAFNPSSFEHVYGFDIFDTMHNFFPEVLYDEELFTGDVENWMRYRMSVFFPGMFARQQNTYRIYRSNDMNNLYQSWRMGNIIPPASTPQFIPPYSSTVNFGPSRPRVVAQRNISPPSTHHSQNERYSHNERNSQNERNSYNRHSRVETNNQYGFQEPSPIRTVRRIQTRPVPQQPNIITTSPENLLVSLLQGSTEFMNSFDTLSHRLWTEHNGLYSDVTIAPSSRQIENASDIKEHENIAQETVCTICQDHETQSERPLWRILRCQHSFHKHCIDHWFERNVHCPVCRTDIREFSRDINRPIERPRQPDIRQSGNTGTVENTGNTGSFLNRILEEIQPGTGPQ